MNTKGSSIRWGDTRPKQHHISCNIPNDLHVALSEYEHRTKLSRSEAVRVIIRAYLHGGRNGGEK